MGERKTYKIDVSNLTPYEAARLVREIREQLAEHGHTLTTRQISQPKHELMYIK